jgi:hypothetical protein
MKALRCGLIGDHISQTQFPAALELMCQEAGIELSFELIDTAGQSDFDFVPFVASVTLPNLAVLRPD